MLKIELFQNTVATWIFLIRMNIACGVVQVAEPDGLSGTRLLAGGPDVAVSD